MTMAFSGRAKLLWLIILMIVLFVSLSVLGVILVSFDGLMRARVAKMIILTDDNAEGMDRFTVSAPGAEYTMKYFFYNVTNLDEYKNDSNNFMPKLEETRPFAFNIVKYQTPIKKSISTISYKPKRKYTFDREQSIEDIDTNVVMPNIPVFMAFDWLSKRPFSKYSGYFLNKYLEQKSENAFITDTVGKLLFWGSHRSVFDAIKMLIEETHMPLDWPFKDDNFALMYERNNTWDPKYDGDLTIYRGTGDNTTIKDITSIIARDGAKQLTFWNEEPKICNQIIGTNGLQFPPFDGDWPQEIYTYQNDVCRSLTFTRKGIDYIKGIRAVVYEFNPENFYSNISDNACYCVDPERTFCHLDGLIDLRSCILPSLYGSKPHFAGGSKWLIDQWPYLKQDPINDFSRIYIEPTTGITLKGFSVFQVNVMVPPLGTNYKMLKFAAGKNMLIPIVRQEEIGILSDASADKLRFSLNMVSVMRAAIIIVSFLTVCGTFMTILLTIRTYQSIGAESEDREPLTDALQTNAQYLSIPSPNVSSN